MKDMPWLSKDMNIRVPKGIPCRASVVINEKVMMNQDIVALIVRRFLVKKGKCQLVRAIVIVSDE